MSTEGTCRICGCKSQEIKNYAFYTFGSEGVEMCFECQVAVSNFIKNMAETCSRVRFGTLSPHKTKSDREK